MSADLTKPFSESCCDGGACSNEMSAQSCGCDPGLKPEPWLCGMHKVKKMMQDELERLQNEMNKETYGTRE